MEVSGAPIPANAVVTTWATILDPSTVKTETVECVLRFDSYSVSTGQTYPTFEMLDVRTYEGTYRDAETLTIDQQVSNIWVKPMGNYYRHDLRANSPLTGCFVQRLINDPNSKIEIMNRIEY